MILPFRAALRPWEAFPLREARWPQALFRMLVWRLPLAWVELVLAWRTLRSLRAEVVALQGPLWSEVLRRLPPNITAADVRDLLSRIPDPAPLALVWPWLALAGAVGILSAWGHHAVWDHGCLWLLGGVGKGGSRFQATLRSEAQAMEVGAVGAALELVRYLPYLGPLLTLPLALTGFWFWILRGFALARTHGTPLWKGVAATLLHGLLAGLCVMALFAALLIQVAGILRASP